MVQFSAIPPITRHSGLSPCADCLRRRAPHGSTCGSGRRNL